MHPLQTTGIADSIAVEESGHEAVEEMDDELQKHVEMLERSIEELKQVSSQALGFVKTVDFEGIHFNVSRRFVIADLSPLAFFHLIEPLENYQDSSIQAAVRALHHRLLPLLTCRHEWTGLKRADDEQVLTIMGGENLGAGRRPNVCKACTAYALEQSLPVVGRSLYRPGTEID